jgi:hypothetical protein
MDERFQVIVVVVNALQLAYPALTTKQRCFAARIIAAALWYLGKTAPKKKGFTVHHTYPRLKAAFELLRGLKLDTESFDIAFQKYGRLEEISKDEHSKIKRYRPSKTDWELKSERTKVGASSV